MDAVSLQLILGRANLTARRLQQALEHIGAPLETAATAALIGEPAERLQSFGLSSAASRWLSAPDYARIERDRRWLERRRVRLIDALSADYPPRLAAARDASAVLFVQGSVAALGEPQLAIVGTRKPSTFGAVTARRFSAELSNAGLCVTSGLAYGIDAAAHEGALRAGGRTIAVLASGLDRLYPREHIALAERIAAHGALVTELPRGTAAVRWSFPRRNRLISGLSLGTLVVEAGEDSGSLITARCARDQGRPVFAIPGSIHNAQARGCHRLIRDGATLVECVPHILRELTGFTVKRDDMLPRSSRHRATAAVLRLDKGPKILLDALGSEPATVDRLVERTGLPSQTISSMLLLLELQGAIGREAGGRYVRL